MLRVDRGGRDIVDYGDFLFLRESILVAAEFATGNRCRLDK